MDPDIILSLVRKIAKNPKGTLTQADFEKVFVAIFSGKNITNIKPLVKLTSVSNLSLVDNEIADLKPLTILKNLVALQLQGNQISILKPVADLLLLEQLHLSRNKIKNLAPLKKLVNLERLNLINNKISNISVLSNFPKLTCLGLNFNDISKPVSYTHLTMPTILRVQVYTVIAPATTQLLFNVAIDRTT